MPSNRHRNHSNTGYGTQYMNSFVFLPLKKIANVTLMHHASLVSSSLALANTRSENYINYSCSFHWLQYLLLLPVLNCCVALLCAVSCKIVAMFHARGGSIFSVVSEVIHSYGRCCGEALTLLQPPDTCPVGGERAAAWSGQRCEMF
ncbi:unnamed protein product [Eretmochelys imbricata]